MTKRCIGAEAQSLFDTAVHSIEFQDAREGASIDDLDAALHWAAQAPCAGTGGVEVRPVMNPPG